jgi:ABC-type antimicrobial peptide transport system permease subunit
MTMRRLRSGLQLVGVGLAVGFVAGLVLSRTISSLLYQTSPADPVAFASTTFVLGVVAFAATYLPARRASKLNPIVALQSD